MGDRGAGGGRSSLIAPEGLGYLGTLVKGRPRADAVALGVPLTLILLPQEPVCEKDYHGRLFAFPDVGHQALHRCNSWKDAGLIVYEWFTGSLYPPDLLKECADLYSEHYGTWSVVAPKARERIRLSPDRIRDWLRSSDSNITLAREDGVLVGYAMAVKTQVPKYGVVSWVTQLVVHDAYRRANIAKTLLFSTWGFSDHFAWGLLTANPYAVRALEKATRRRAIPSRIRRNARKLLRVGSEHVPYVRGAMEMVVTNDQSRLNTEFFLDHSRLPEMIASAASVEKPWLLGILEEGWEWFAFAFQDQPQISLTPTEIAEMLKASDDITRQAYSRMQLGENHAWSRHTGSEVEFIPGGV